MAPARLTSGGDSSSQPHRPYRESRPSDEIERDRRRIVTISRYPPRSLDGDEQT